jgi:hypothetical protein
VGSADINRWPTWALRNRKGMKPVPFGKDTLLQLAAISLAPWRRWS